VITAGALTLSGFDEYKEYFDMSGYNAAPITSIVFGSIVFLIAFMGCCGVLRENNRMLMTVSASPNYNWNLYSKMKYMNNVNVAHGNPPE
jgi:hypothetical protein